jgi:hypothetical protein
MRARGLPIDFRMLCGDSGYVAASQSMPGTSPGGDSERNITIFTPRRCCPFSERASVSPNRSARDCSKFNPDEVAQTSVARLSARTGSRLPQVYAISAVNGTRDGRNRYFEPRPFPPRHRGVFSSPRRPLGCQGIVTQRDLRPTFTFCRARRLPESFGRSALRGGREVDCSEIDSKWLCAPIGLGDHEPVCECGASALIDAELVRARLDIIEAE